MSIFGFIKNGRKQKLNLMPNSYPSSRVTYNNGNVSDALDGKVSKSGDTMSGRLSVFHSDEVQLIASREHNSTTPRPSTIAIGNNIPSGTAGSDYGRLILYGTGSEYTRIEPTNTSNRRIISLPDASGTLALKPIVDSLESNLLISTSDAWSVMTDPNLNLDNYEYIGFSWTMSDDAQTQKQIQTIMKMSDFKTSSQSAPVIIVDDPYSAFSDVRRLKVAWNSSSSFSVYRGSEVYMYRRLNIFGIKF